MARKQSSNEAGELMTKDAIKQRAKSKTYYFGLAIMVLGYAEANFSVIQNLFGTNAGYVNCGIGLAILVLRELTKTPLNQK